MTQLELAKIFLELVYLNKAVLAKPVGWGIF